MNLNDRKSSLKKFGLRKETVADVLAMEASSDGCAAHRYQDNGWSNGGFILVDPAVRAMTAEEAARCAIAGFDYLLGVPISSGTFALKSFPNPATGALILDYVKLCAYNGESDVSPKIRSRFGVTNYPALRCVRRNIDVAIDLSKKTIPGS
ncbi:hypothetical protein QA648_28290 (plasmid) [Rhizobium sp. CB3171]|uniref:hypothetical protein n=1 Tax=Rhizobium sp. CB3171 TaxID=3039157 RepID=UPI0024B0425F|nr:hypothetical protein [Rhizobium sp. CB3171]WFU04669.1 hypothetical protein QA648_28290 [Rhizobium sp. CB3171]